MPRIPKVSRKLGDTAYTEGGLASKVPWGSGSLLDRKRPQTQAPRSFGAIASRLREAMQAIQYANANRPFAVAQLAALAHLAL